MPVQRKLNLILIAAVLAVPALSFGSQDQLDKQQGPQQNKQEKQKDQKDQQSMPCKPSKQNEQGRMELPGQCDPDLPKGPLPAPAPGTERFNVVCYYHNDEAAEGYKNCKAAAVFDKAVTEDGGEVIDESPESNDQKSLLSPLFVVSCGKKLRWNDHARRFTGLLNTRIQALTGPHPAIYLPRGALHTGHHVADSFLEIDQGDQQLQANGQCYIWVGRP